MSLLQIFIIAVVQGVTEFLPVSSSGHLILIPSLTGYEDQGQVIDVAVHLGTLVAVVLFFRDDVRAAIGGVPRLVRGRVDTPGARLAFLLLVATLPVVVAGFVLNATGLDDALRSITVIGWTMIIFGVVLYLADKRGGLTKHEGDWSLRDAVIMGLWQALALIPGTSRSGATISGARALGYAREDGAKLAMLMSIPTIIASGTLLGIEVVGTANVAAARDGLIAAALSCVAALLALSLMMRLLKSVSFTPYVIYRIALGGVLLWIAYS
ncbi:undecaprenyl-diphosphate phosphatase [Aliiroseovarius sp.]|uniref:undecaprenyl-diphosphate phosphatase n=1 Tax=Aliiroseovarius sp. TaxID=1872442 RepID=UPI0026341654|nr:undecaprenyl-diphosphate phosphatase [Aliiroseovarius sp.]